MIIIPKKVKLRDALVKELRKNDYLIALHRQLLKVYCNQMLGGVFSINKKEIQDLLTFADLMAKTNDVELEQSSLEIVICLSKLYPDSHSIKF